MQREAKDIVVLDVKMPGLDRIETLRRLKTAHPECEVILLTGHASPPEGVERIEAGAFDYLTKSVEFEHLLRKITQARNKIERLCAVRREAEFREQVRRQMAVAERLAALGTLASGVAHEINNPLAVIQESAGWLQQILEKPETADMPRRGDFEEALARIQRAVRAPVRSRGNCSRRCTTRRGIPWAPRSRGGSLSSRSPKRPSPSFDPKRPTEGSGLLWRLPNRRRPPGPTRRCCSR